MTKSITAQCLYKTGKSMRLLRHRRGFMTYTLEEGTRLVLMLNVDEQVPGSSIRLGRELVLEVAAQPALKQVLDVTAWVPQLLYKFGGPQVQFESMTASGTLQIDSLKHDGICHGKLALAFKAPTIDKAGAGGAELALSF